MNIDIYLSTESIADAINELQIAKDILEVKTEELVEILANEGEERANAAYGSMVTAEAQASGTKGEISVSGGDRAIIAEFGAGYATMESHPFASNAPVTVEVASYSREHDDGEGGGLFWRTHQKNPGAGFWMFGNNPMSRVEPRHGLLDAYDYIMNEGVRIAQEVIRFD